MTQQPEKPIPWWLTIDVTIIIISSEFGLILSHEPNRPVLTQRSIQSIESSLYSKTAFSRTCLTSVAAIWSRLSKWG